MVPQFGWMKTSGVRAAATGSPEFGSPKISASAAPVVMFCEKMVPGGRVSAKMAAALLRSALATARPWSSPACARSQGSPRRRSESDRACCRACRCSG